jgi:hypothetical protein
MLSLMMNFTSLWRKIQSERTVTKTSDAERITALEKRVAALEQATKTLTDEDIKNVVAALTTFGNTTLSVAISKAVVAGLHKGMSEIVSEGID